MILYPLYIGIYIVVYLLVVGCNRISKFEPLNCRGAAIFIVLIAAIGLELHAVFGPFPLRTELVNLLPQNAPAIDPGIYLKPAFQLAALVGLYELYLRWRPVKK